MNVTTIEVSFRRTKQPAQYESADPFVRLVANVEDGGDHLAIGADLMADAQQIVYGALGLDTPAEPSAKLASLGLASNVEVVKTEGVAAAPATRRGRPAMTAAEKAAAKAAKTIPPAGTTGQQTPPAAADNIHANPEDRKDPAANAGPDVPGDPAPAGTATPAVQSAASPAAAAAAAEVPEDGKVSAVAPQPAPATGPKALTAQDLQGFITENVQKKKISVQAVKEQLAKFGAQRTSELAPENVAKVYKAIEEAVELAALNA